VCDEDLGTPTGGALGGRGKFHAEALLVGEVSHVDGRHDLLAVDTHPFGGDEVALDDELAGFPPLCPLVRTQDLPAEVGTTVRAIDLFDGVRPAGHEPDFGAAGEGNIRDLREQRCLATVSSTKCFGFKVTQIGDVRPTCSADDPAI